MKHQIPDYNLLLNHPKLNQGLTRNSARDTVLRYYGQLRFPNKPVNREGVVEMTKMIPCGVDEKVWKGVLVGLNAMRKRNSPEQTAYLDISRNDQRLFTLPTALDEGAARVATVVLNGVTCIHGRDYRITDYTFNWVSDRKLFRTDCIAIKYPVAPAITMAPSVTPVSASVVGFHDYSSSIIDTNTRIQAIEQRIIVETKKLTERIAEMEVVTEAVAAELDQVAGEVADLGASLEVSEQEGQEQPVEVTKEEEMIEPGVKVWHRLTEEGPWIVVQPTVLNINSRQEGGDDNRFSQSFVECAWTVQTEDGVRDFPEVILTTRKPKVQGRHWAKKLACGVGVVAVTAAVVHAPLLAKLLGLLQ